MRVSLPNKDTTEVESNPKKGRSIFAASLAQPQEFVKLKQHHNPSRLPLEGGMKHFNILRWYTFCIKKQICSFPPLNIIHKARVSQLPLYTTTWRNWQLPSIDSASELSGMEISATQVLILIPRIRILSITVRRGAKIVVITVHSLLVSSFDLLVRSFPDIYESFPGP